jgi:RNA polymerase sigma factor (sigma-70 family)
MDSPAKYVTYDDADLVQAARGTEPHAFGELFERWYDRCFDVALNIVRNRETAADIAQDTFLVCWERLGELRDPAAFGGWVLRTARNRALNRLERERARFHESIDAEEPMAIPDADADPAAHAEQDDRQRLVWTAAAALGHRDTSLLDLHLRHGLEPSEIAEELSITPNNAYQLLHRLRNKLKDMIGAVLLWRDGNPTCEDLAGLVAWTGEFDAGTAATIRRHQRKCLLCSGEMRRQTQPELLFTAMPLAVVSLALKERARAALAEAGVPLLTSTSQAAATTVLGAEPGSAPPCDVSVLGHGGGPRAAADHSHIGGGHAAGTHTAGHTGHAMPDGLSLRVFAAVSAAILVLGAIGVFVFPRFWKDDGGSAVPGISRGQRAVALPAPVSSLTLSPSTSPTGATSSPTASASSSASSRASSSSTGGPTTSGGSGVGGSGSSNSTQGSGKNSRQEHKSSSGSKKSSGSSSRHTPSTSLPGWSGNWGENSDARRQMVCPSGRQPTMTTVYLTDHGYLVVTGHCGSVRWWWMVASTDGSDLPHGSSIHKVEICPGLTLFSSRRAPAPALRWTVDSSTAFWWQNWPGVWTRTYPQGSYSAYSGYSGRWW